MLPDLCDETRTEAFIVEVLTALLLPFAILVLCTTAAWDYFANLSRGKF